METALEQIADAVEQASHHGLPLLIGGEHTATLGAVRGALRHYPDLYVIQLDAHLDLRDTYDGVTLSHATVMRRVIEAIGGERLVQLGIRSGVREEFEVASRCLASSPWLTLTPDARLQISEHPIYLTIDIDVLDPAGAPGTGCPEPGGPSFAELLSFIYSLKGLNVIAADVTEVLPSSDVNDVTSVAAAKLLREIALLFAKPYA